MKYLKYILLTSLAAFALFGCDKHDLSYAPSDPASEKALFQITYVVPQAVNANNAIDSVYLNDKLIGGVGGAGQLAVNGTFPYGPSAYTGTYFTTNPGNNNLKLYKKGDVVYDKNVNLTKGRQQIFVFSLSEDPIILDSQYPFSPVNPEKASARTFDTDSVATIRFYNFVWQNSTTPYQGKLKYQWRDNTGAKNPATGDYYWNDLGDYVGFGEATDRVPVIVHKSVFNSSGYNTLRFHCIDENGKEVTRSTDYWTVYIGRSVNHIFRGCISGTPAAAYTQSSSLGANY